ncbi:MAG: MraY family glycosyltransferase [Phycisphaerae bacterium]|jgi:UDP-GlcNAc:undecaprenyl-phosphate GlcNAc-1-phosphate transferase
MNRANLLLALAGALGISLVLSLLLTALVMRISRRIGFVDRPGGHKSHKEPVPYGGGVAIFLAAWVPATAAIILAVTVSQAWIAQTFGEEVRAYVGGLCDRATQALVILAGGLVLHLLGLLDDRRPLGPILKLFVIVGVSLFVILAGHVYLGSMLGRPLSILLTLGWFVVIINAMNFLDNMDGLSAGVAWICMAFLAVCGLLAEPMQVLVPALACLFLGAIGGFWAFNFPPARIFMGDAGSLLIGYMLAVVSVLTTYYQSGQPGAPYALAMPLVVLAVPLYDFTSVISIRIAEGRNPLRGDQRHFSHRLIEHGLDRRLAVLTIYLATATTGLAATLLPGADLPRTITVAVIVLMILAVVAILESPPRREP